MIYCETHQTFPCNSLDLLVHGDENPNISFYSKKDREDISFHPDGWIDVDITEKEITKEKVISILKTIFYGQKIEFYNLQ